MQCISNLKRSITVQHTKEGWPPNFAPLRALCNFHQVIIVTAGYILTKKKKNYYRLYHI